MPENERSVDWKTIVAIAALVASLGSGAIGLLRTSDREIAELRGRIGVLETKLDGEVNNLSTLKLEAVRREVDLALKPLSEKIDMLIARGRQ